jgi:methyl-accepting chemotaxis protein
MDRIGIGHRLFEKRWFYSLKSKLILSFLAISIIPLTAVVTLAYLQFQESLRSQASNQLVVVRDLKVKQVRSYLRRIEQDINLVAQLPYVKTAIQQLEIGVRGQGLNQVRQMGFLGRPDLFYLAAYHPYAVYHAKYHAFFRELVQTKGYADIWLVSPEGDIIYTFAKRDDFATNLLQAPNQDTPPVRLFQNLLAKAETGRVQMTPRRRCSGQFYRGSDFG